MKAKVKESGLIVDVCECSDGKYYQSECGRTISDYTADELDFNLDTELNEDNFTKSQKQSVTIDGWVCKDRIGTYLCKYEPVKDYPNGLWSKINSEAIKLPTSSFPDLKWEDEPRKCRIRIEEI